MAADMLVNLYELPEVGTVRDESIKVHRILPPDAYKLKEFIRKNFSEEWVGEAEAALSRPNPTCFIAMKNQEVIGFACFDATAPGMFGPTGVRKDIRGLNVGKVLLLKTLYAMKDFGYGYAIIGGVDSARGFYEKSCNALWLDMYKTSIYERMLWKN